jgi:hypothetical protein
VLQWYYSGVTVAGELPSTETHSGDDGAGVSYSGLYDVIMVLDGFYSDVTVMVDGCYSGVTVMLQWCYSGEGVPVRRGSQW